MQVYDGNLRPCRDEAVPAHVVCLCLPAARVYDQNAAIVCVFERVDVAGMEDVGDVVDYEEVLAFW